MVDIQPATAKIRRGKKEREEEDKRKPQGKNIMACLLDRAAITRKKDRGRMLANAQRNGRPGARAPENVYIVYQPRRRPNAV